MEVVMNLKGLDKECECGSKKIAANCCRKDELCPCSSQKKASECCFKEAPRKNASTGA